MTPIAANAELREMHCVLRDWARRGCAIGLVSMTVAWSQAARADEGGVSFWVPGFYGSLAATPQVPGWSIATIYYHTSVTGGPDVAFAREVPVGRLNVNFTGNINTNLKADADIGFALPQYVFAQPLLGGQAAVGLLVPVGSNRVGVDALLTG